MLGCSMHSRPTLAENARYNRPTLAENARYNSLLKIKQTTTTALLCGLRTIYANLTAVNRAGFLHTVSIRI